MTNEETPVATDCRTLEPMSEDEIDDLCDKLNTTKEIWHDP